MATVTIKHGTLTGAAANPNVLVDGPKWDASHTVTGLENVDNTSDANKPISTATQNALTAITTARPRTALLADTIFYVRTDGSDSNTGLANTAGGAWLTPQHAADVILKQIDTNGFNITIVLTGAFTTGMAFAGPIVGSGTVTVTTLTSASIATTDTNGISASFGASVIVGGNITFSTATATTKTPAALSAWAYGRIQYTGGGTFTPSVGPAMQAGWRSDTSFAPSLVGVGTIVVTGDYTIGAGSGLSHYHVTGAGSSITLFDGVTVTLTGTPAFSAYFIGMSVGGIFYAPSATFSGAATGKRFYIHHMASATLPIGAGLTFFPGSIAGEAVAGGLYATNDDATSIFGVGTLVGGVAASSTLTLQSTSAAGTTDAIIGKTGSQVERFRITTDGKFNIGPAVAPDGLLTINANTAASVAPTITSPMHIIGADSQIVGVTIDAFGSVFGSLNFRLAKGTIAGKTGVVATDTILNLQGDGWDTAAYASGVTIRGRATETWSATAHGSEIALRTVPNTTTTPADGLVVRNSGGVTVGTTTDPGIGAILAANSIKSNGATAGVGYATGAGGAVTQATSRTTGVTLNTVAGAITLVSAAGVAASYTSFTVTNSAVAATDTVILSQKSGTDKYNLHPTAVGAGSFEITFRTTGGTTVEQPVFNFAVIKAVAA